MASLCYQYLTIVAKNFIFFGGDVQTTTIAVAIASSFCYSIVWAICRIVTQVYYIQPAQATEDKRKSGLYTSSLASLSSPGKSSARKVKTHIEYGVGEESLFGNKVEVPCVRCCKFLADTNCRFVTCKLCCFCPSLCVVHENSTDIKCRPFSPLDHFGVTEINLSDCRIQECPKRIGYFGSQLTLLNLCCNNLTELPQEIGCLRGLQELYLHKNSIYTLPETLGSLVNLQILDISQNEIHSLPDCFSKESQLHHLDLSHNEISCLPYTFRHLTQLTILHFQNNKFTDIPEVLCHLKKLQTLDISHNKITKGFLHLESLLCLQELTATCCELYTFPLSLCYCSSLRRITINSNKLEELPAEIGLLHNLTELNVASNRLRYLPSTVDLSLFKSYNVIDNLYLSRSEDTDRLTIQNMTCSPDHNFPSLLELSARTIVTENCLDHAISILPSCLQDMLKKKGTCTRCGGAFFEFHQSELTFRRCTQGSIPFYSRVCCPHRVHHCVPNV